IIEVHGIQHYTKSFKRSDGRTRSLKEEQENDTLKENLAKQNGIIYYIIFDCSISNIDYIKNSVLNNSHFLDLFNLSNVNWTECHKFACKSLVKDACDLWNEGNNAVNIGNKMKLSHSTIVNYLKQGSQIGWCNYDL